MDKDIYSFGLVLTNKCVYNCFNCEGKDYIYRDMKPESFDFIEQFSKKYKTELIVAGKEIMLESDKIERILNIKTADIVLITTGVVNIDKLEKYLIDYDNIKMLLLSCHGSPEVEKKIRNDKNDLYDYESRKWITKYKCTPIYDLIFLNHVVYRHNIIDDSCYENINYVIKNYPGANILISFDYFDLMEDIDTKIKKYLLYLKELKLQGHRIEMPVRLLKSFPILIEDNDIMLFHEPYLRIHIPEIKSIDNTASLIKVFNQHRHEILKCDLYKSFKQCGGPYSCGEPYPYPWENYCRKFWENYKKYIDIFGE